MDLKKSNFPREKFEEKRVCDGCARTLEQGDHVIEYFCDTIWQGYERINLPEPAPVELYCLYCNPDDVPVPHIGTNEGFSFLTIKNDSEDDLYSYDDAGIMKGNPSSKGIEWSPVDVLEDIHPAPIESLPHVITPMLAFSMCRRTGVDLRGFISDGQLVIPEKAKKKANQLARLYISSRHTTVLDPSML